MTGIRLEVDTLIIHGGIPFLKNVHKAISQAGLEVDQLVVAPLASAQAVLSKRQKELGVAVVDMGAGTTSMVVYEENNVLHTTVIPIGSMHITNDIAIGLRCTVETAEKVKLQYGHALTREVDSYEQIDLSLIDPDESGTVSRMELVEIIEARLEEIFDQVHRELKAVNRDGKLPAGIVFTGGGAHLPGLSDYAKEYIHLPTHIGMLQGVETIIDQVNDPAFATVVGTLLWGYTYGQPRGGSSWFSLGSFFDHETMVKLKKFWKSFLP
jgi:cell division protein FtsA